MKKFYSNKNQTKILKQIARREINRNLESKRSAFTAPDGVEILHNNFVELDANILHTTQGLRDPMAAQTENRVGDEIMLKGVKMKMMIELNERYSDVTFRLMIIKSAKGDVPTRATLFAGLTGNKMLDTINNERYTVMYQKWFKIKAAGYGNFGTDLGLPPNKPIGFDIPMGK